jgi:hypothetical protein
MSFFKQVRESVIDYQFYNKIKNNSFAKSFVYLLLLFLIIYSLGAICDYTYIGNELDVVASQTMFDKGNLIFNGPMPYYLIKDDQNLFVIDTTGKITVDNMNQVYNGILFTNEAMIVKNLGQVKINYYKDLKINNEDLQNYFYIFHYVIIFALVLAFVLFLASKVVNAVLLALFAMAINHIYKTNLRFGALLNISIYALTLPMLLELAIKLSGYGMPIFSLLYWAVSIAYITRVLIYERDSKNGEIPKNDSLNI